MKTFIIALIVLSACAFPQQAPKKTPKNNVIRKIKIKHADPMLIMLLLQGKTTTATPSEIKKP
jgi:hypothetical protein